MSNGKGIEPTFRAAAPGDASAVAGLMYRSSRTLYDYVYPPSRVDAQQFLEKAFLSEKSFMSYRWQTVGEYNGEIIFSVTEYPGRLIARLTWQAVTLSFASFRFTTFLGVLLRSLKLSRLFVRPDKQSLFLANACTDERYRGQGVCSRYLTGLLAAPHPSYALLEFDVSMDNDRAMKLYERLGFTVYKERDSFTPARLPGNRRMRYRFP